MTKNMLRVNVPKCLCHQESKKYSDIAALFKNTNTGIIFASPLRFLPLLEPAPSSTFSFDAPDIRRAKASKRPVDAIDKISGNQFYISFANQGKLEVWQMECKERRRVYDVYRSEITKLADGLFNSQSSTDIAALTIADFNTHPGWRYVFRCPSTGSFFHMESYKFKLHGGHPLNKFFWQFSDEKAASLVSFFTRHTQFAIMGMEPFVHDVRETTQKLLYLFKSNADTFLDGRFILKEKAQGTVPAGQNAAPKYTLWTPQTYVSGAWQPPLPPLSGLRV